MRRFSLTEETGRRRLPSRGFTLIEVVIAIMLFSVVLIAAGGMIMTLARGAAYSGTRTNTALHMQRQIERFRTLDYANLGSASADTTLPGGAQIRAEWTMSELVPGRLAQIDLAVYRTPSGPGGSRHAVRLFIANRAP